MKNYLHRKTLEILALVLWKCTFLAECCWPKAAIWAHLNLNKWFKTAQSKIICQYAGDETNRILKFLQHVCWSLACLKIWIYGSWIKLCSKHVPNEFDEFVSSSPNRFYQPAPPRLHLGSSEWQRRSSTHCPTSCPPWLTSLWQVS